MTDKAKRILRKLYGHHCWHPRRGYGSALLLDFGQPNLEIGKTMDPIAGQTAGSRHSRRSRIVRIRGEWGILIDCCGWQLIQDDSKLARWTSSKQKVDLALRALEGQALTKIDIDPKKLLTTFEFDLGAKLQTFPYGSEADDHWIIYQSARSVLSFGLNGIQA